MTMILSPRVLTQKKKMASSLLDAVNELAKTEVESRLHEVLDSLDSFTRDFSTVLRSSGEPAAESLRRDVFKLRDEGRLLKKTHNTTKKKFRKVGALLLDPDAEFAELGAEVRRVMAAVKEIVNANRRFQKASDALDERIRMVDKLRKNKATADAAGR
jgi:hypothetical protein